MTIVEQYDAIDKSLSWLRSQDYVNFYVNLSGEDYDTLVTGADTAKSIINKLSPRFLDGFIGFCIVSDDNGQKVYPRFDSMESLSNYLAYRVEFDARKLDWCNSNTGE